LRRNHYPRPFIGCSLSRFRSYLNLSATKDKHCRQHAGSASTTPQRRGERKVELREFAGVQQRESGSTVFDSVMRAKNACWTGLEWVRLVGFLPGKLDASCRREWREVEWGDGGFRTFIALSYAVERVGYFNQAILISFSTSLNSGSPVTSSTFRSLARAAAKQSA
jgi:hypothetical protein